MSFDEHLVKVVCVCVSHERHYWFWPVAVERENSVTLIQFPQRPIGKHCPVTPWVFKILYIYKYVSLFQNICLKGLYIYGSFKISSS